MDIALIGYGKMGKMIESLAVAKGHRVVLCIGSENPSELTAENLANADVAIEFSRPEIAFDNISACLRAGVPVVSGTTAWLERLEEAKAICAAEKGAFFYASNFSIGVNLFFTVSRYLASQMENYPQYDVQMEEVHHTQKVDYPSGTAITLAEGIFEEISRKKNWKAILAGVSGKAASSVQTDELLITSRREDGVPGTHTIAWQSAIDTIEIKHTAHSREGFATGALTAAAWLIGRQGFFGMSDLLGA